MAELDVDTLEVDLPAYLVAKSECVDSIVCCNSSEVLLTTYAYPDTQKVVKGNVIWIL